MRSYLASFIFFILLGCSSKPLTLSPTQYTFIGKTRTKQVDKENPKLDSSVYLKEIQSSFWGRKAVLEIQGWYSSEGLQARKLNKIQMVEEVEGNQLTITFYVQPKSGMGKESAQVYGYNYQQEIVIKVPSTANQLTFKLIEQDANQQDILSYQAHVDLPKK